jgi:hypothetical protein
MEIKPETREVRERVKSNAVQKTGRVSQHNIRNLFPSIVRPPDKARDEASTKRAPNLLGFGVVLVILRWMSNPRICVGAL